MHWNGAHWKLQPTLALAKGTSYYELDSVDATSGSNVFAAGHYRRGTSTYPLVMHWNGTKWSKQAAPQPGSSAEFTGVTTLGPNAAWAVGEHGGKTLIEHWNGSKWTVERTPSPGTYNGLWGVDAVSSASLWAVGGYNDGAVHPLSLRPS